MRWVLVVCVFLALCGTGLTAAIDPGVFSPEAATLYTELSYASYCTNKSITDWSCYWCRHSNASASFQPFGFPSNQRANLVGIVGVQNQLKQIIVIFRGTRPLSFKNWLRDLNFPHSQPYHNDSSLQVHTGFYDGYLKLRPQVLNYVGQLRAKYPSYKLVVTGHSLGGAFATLAAVDLEEMFGTTYVWTMGCPRVGNKGFADFFWTKLQNRSFRLTQHRDIVVHLPMNYLGFYHVSREYFHTTERKGWRECRLGEDGKCSDKYLIWSIPDHLHYSNMWITGGCIVGIGNDSEEYARRELAAYGLNNDNVTAIDLLTM